MGGATKKRSPICGEAASGPRWISPLRFSAADVRHATRRACAVMAARPARQSRVWSRDAPAHKLSRRVRGAPTYVGRILAYRNDYMAHRTSLKCISCSHAAEMGLQIAEVREDGVVVRWDLILVDTGHPNEMYKNRASMFAAKNCSGRRYMLEKRDRPIKTGPQASVRLQSASMTPAARLRACM